MSWNNAKETLLFKKKQERNRIYYRKNGISEDQIAIIEQYDKEIFNYRRNQGVFGDEIYPFTLEESDSDYKKVEDLLAFNDDIILNNPFEYGFEDARLNYIWRQTDDTEKLMIMLLSDGLSHEQIALQIGVTQQSISKKIKKIKKILDFGCENA